MSEQSQFEDALNNRNTLMVLWIIQLKKFLMHIYVKNINFFHLQ